MNAYTNGPLPTNQWQRPKFYSATLAEPRRGLRFMRSAYGGPLNRIIGLALLTPKRQRIVCWKTVR